MRTHDGIKTNNILINTREHICNQMVYINEACGEHFVHEFSSSWSGAITDIKPYNSSHELCCSVSESLIFYIYISISHVLK